jgi:isobutyryl-CoA mutase
MITAVAEPSTAPSFALKHRVRFVTAASLFDGHDAAIQIMRRILQAEGAEVIHLGHDRSVQEVVDAAICEDAQGIAISSYQGGHVEYFCYMIDLLKERGAGHIQVYGGGGGVIVPAEIELLHKRGVARIFSPDDGRRMGLVGMIRSMLVACDRPPGAPQADLPSDLDACKAGVIARGLTTLEAALDDNDDVEVNAAAEKLRGAITARLRGGRRPPVVGITGTGGAGKSSLIDELLLRLLETFPQKRVAVLSVDPTRRRTGGALLGDRIRMNAARDERVFVRSMATRRANLATSAAVRDSLALLQASGFDLIILETAGIGQSDSEVSELCDLSMYVMTPEFGAPSQLEKIDMLDFADLVAINKFDKRGAADALRDVRKAYQRNHQRFDEPPEAMPVFGTSAHRFHDPGTNAVFNALIAKVASLADAGDWAGAHLEEGPPKTDSLIPQARTRYLADIVETIRRRRRRIDDQALLAERAHGVARALTELDDEPPPGLRAFATEGEAATAALRKRYNELLKELGDEARELLESFDETLASYAEEKSQYEVRGKTFTVENYTESLSQRAIPKVAVPTSRDWGERLRFALKENVPGRYPFTAGVFPYKRTGEDPTRMFAGEGTAERTNRRFHYVSKGPPAVRLSTAFDSVTLYGADPDPRPDIYGKVGNSGVSVCSLDDAKRLYSGFDLCAPSTSVSMTINGPAPTILAFFFNAAIDAACERKLKAEGRWQETEAKVEAFFKERGVQRPTYRGELPDSHDGMGLGFLGVSADRVMDKAEYDAVKATVLQAVRGTVQADILKEDQAQNTCIFSTEFALRMMGDVQAFFIDEGVRNFYSVSISGYHIAEAGANPITQLAFTLANGFTLVEYYRARGMDVDKFAPNFSFFFSNGLDPEYAVIGRVARRIWAVAMREMYGASERSQKLKYHIQTSGRSLHAQEIDFNDIRTTLQALYAIVDNCNSLHTNAYDEAITTPTEESVRRAIAIQLIINRELGMTKNENPLQGSFFLDYMTDLVEAAVLEEFESLDARGGVLGAMETMYQRGKIQDESLYYEHKKHSGELPIVGVNTYLVKDGAEVIKETALIRSTDDEKQLQIEEVRGLQERFGEERAAALVELKRAAKENENLFAALMEAAKVCSLGSISNALYEVGGAYRRNM